MDFLIDRELKDLGLNINFGVLIADVSVNEKNLVLDDEMEDVIQKVKKDFSGQEVNQIPRIQALREAYKKLGKDPSRYRGSAEALVRRILQEKGLYRINNVINANNIVSLETCYPVGSYDFDQIKEPFVFRRGKKDESYKGIGKECINLENLPLFSDKLGPFGSPTSDSDRTLVTIQTKRIMTIIISFNGTDQLQIGLERMKGLIEKFASATNCEMFIM